MASYWLSCQIERRPFVGEDAWMKQILKYDWDVIAGVLAAVIALILHFLHIATGEVILAVILALFALSLLRDLRAESRSLRLAEEVERINGRLLEVRQALVRNVSMTLRH
jgi:hypothetical protein